MELLVPALKLESQVMAQTSRQVKTTAIAQEGIVSSVP